MDYIEFTEGMADALECARVTSEERGEVIRAVLAYVFEQKPLPCFEGREARLCAAHLFYETMTANPDGLRSLTDEEMAAYFG